MIMSMNVFDNLFNITGMHAVFVMLVDSLWIGALTALLAGIIITLTKKQGPQLRYQLLTGLLGLFVLSMVFVFYTAFTKETHAVVDGNETIVVASTSTTIQSITIQPKPKNIFDTGHFFHPGQCRHYRFDMANGYHFQMPAAYIRIKFIAAYEKKMGIGSRRPLESQAA